MHLVKEDILDKYNCVFNRMDDMKKLMESYDVVPQVRLKMINDSIDNMDISLDIIKGMLCRRAVNHQVEQDRRIV